MENGKSEIEKFDEVVNSACEVIKKTYLNQTTNYSKLNSNQQELKQITRNLNEETMSLNSFLRDIKELDEEKFCRVYGNLYIKAKTEEWNKIIISNLEEQIDNRKLSLKDKIKVASYYGGIGILSFILGIQVNKLQNFDIARAEVKAAYQSIISTKDASYKILYDDAVKRINAKDKEIDELKKKVRR